MGKLAVFVVCCWLIFSSPPFHSGRQIGFLHVFIFQVCWSPVILAYPICKRFCFQSVMLSCCHCFQFNRFYFFKPGSSNWAVFCLAAGVHLKLMLIVVVKLRCLCVYAWMQMRSGRINIQTDRKMQELLGHNSEEARVNLNWLLTIWGDGAPCVKQRKCGKGVKLQYQSL